MIYHPSYHLHETADVKSSRGSILGECRVLGYFLELGGQDEARGGEPGEKRRFDV